MSYQQLSARVSYDPLTGVFTWTNAPAQGKARNGARAGFFTTNGYREIGLCGKRYAEHTLAWLMMTGDMPSLVDHINGDGTDNRFENLRQASRSQNQWNTRRGKNNKSGYKGVSWSAKANKWQVFARINGKNKNLGLYGDIEKAASAYKDFVMKLRGVFAKF